MFQWRADSVALMLAPWTRPVAHQRHVRASVRVVEETSPAYALVVMVELTDAIELPSKRGLRIVRKVTKQHMAQVFELAMARAHDGRNDVALLQTRPLGCVSGRAGAEVAPTVVDMAVAQWLMNGKHPPTREQLVLWLLSRMVVVVKEPAEAPSLVLCGEEGAPRTIDATHTLFITEPDRGNGDDGESDSLPSYSDSPRREEFASPTDVDDAFGGGLEDGDESMPAMELTHDVTTKRIFNQNTELVQKRVHGRSQVGSLAICRGSEPPLTRNEFDELDHQDPGTHVVDTFLPAHSLYRFEPATVRMRSNSTTQRRDSLSLGVTFVGPNAWTEERRHFQLELKQSQRDIESTQARQRKAQTIASLRRQQVIQQSQRKLQTHEQRMRDSRMVKESIADTLEYHDIRQRMESELKQTRISASREQERLVRSMRIAVGRSEKWQKGPVLGPGPLSQVEIDLGSRSKIQIADGGKPGRQWVYDMHGRRHSEQDAGQVAANNVFESAMKKLQRLVDRKNDEHGVDLFRRYDFNRSGTLDYTEFQQLLRENGVEFSKDQAATFFQHFDPNGSGSVDYGEMLWGFFNRRELLKRWQQMKTRLSSREIKLLFYKYDRVGRGALSLPDFQLAMDNIGFRLTDSEAKLLGLKFDVNKDGYIDYNEFHAFVNDGDGEADLKETTESKTKTKRSVSTPPKCKTVSKIQNCPNSSEDMDRILTELRELGESQAQIRRAILKN